MRQRTTTIPSGGGGIFSFMDNNVVYSWSSGCRFHFYHFFLVWSHSSGHSHSFLSTFCFRAKTKYFGSDWLLHVRSMIAGIIWEDQPTMSLILPVALGDCTSIALLQSLSKCNSFGSWDTLSGNKNRRRVHYDLTALLHNQPMRCCLVPTVKPKNLSIPQTHWLIALECSLG